ncbi:chaperonin 10-like protein [Geopyxis carbonaria]|nr:chaperonin 10-like protein [Geopyxis carbonaria]
MSTHAAAVLPSKGSRLEILQRPTPTPPAGHVLLAVSAIALNPVDYHHRDNGFYIETYPAVFGTDTAGTILSTGPSVPAHFTPGTRVAALATAYFSRGVPDLGGFQERVIVPYQHLAVLPDTLPFAGAAMLPLALTTAATGWRLLGLPRGFRAPAGTPLLVWGASGSVGSVCVQTARAMGFTVYATGSAKHHDYLRTLGAAHVFDYHDADVVDQIVAAVRKNGGEMTMAYHLTGSVTQCTAVLAAVRPEGVTAVFAAAFPIPKDEPKVEGVEGREVWLPEDEEKRNEMFAEFMQDMGEALATGELVPSPKLQKVEGGLEALNGALDTLRAGVSGVKIVLEI